MTDHATKKMEEYSVLNAIKPTFSKTKYPYNLIDPAKIIFTQKKVEIMAKELSSQKKGGYECPPIVFYG